MEHGEWDDGRNEGGAGNDGGPSEQADADFNGTYYDVRIQSHYFGTQRQIVFVFTNVSAEKGLQRELVMKQYMQIMFTSISHELRTPINAIQNSLTCMKSFVSPAGIFYLDICDSSSAFLLSLVNDTLDFA